MPLRLLRAPLQLAVPALLALTLVAMVLGSSWTPTVQMRFSTPRWIVLLALGGASLWVVRRTGARLIHVGLPLLPLLGLMVLSAAWSVDGKLTLERGISLGVVFGIAAAVAAGIESRLVAPEWIALAVVGAMCAVAVGGLILLAVSPRSGMHPGTGRLNGLGGDANTVSSMLALGLPLALVLALRAHARTRASWLAIAALALLAGSIVASGSRGALLAGAAGCALTVALVARDWAARARGLGVLALAVALAAAAMAQPIGSTVTHGPAPTSRFGSVHTGPGGRYTNAELTRRLEDDVGASNPGEPLVDPHRTFLNSSGRGEAWVGALKQAAQRPTVGFGFGTEPRVFVDRYVAFQGGYVENAYIGLVLQLGAAGLVLFALAIVVVGRRIAARLPAAAGDDRRLAAGFAGVVAGGLALAATQSFVYSAGNVATVPFWVATLAAVATLRERRPGR